MKENGMDGAGEAEWGRKQHSTFVQFTWAQYYYLNYSHRTDEMKDFHHTLSLLWMYNCIHCTHYAIPITGKWRKTEKKRKAIAITSDKSQYTTYTALDEKCEANGVRPSNGSHSFTKIALVSRQLKSFDSACNIQSYAIEREGERNNRLE